MNSWAWIGLIGIIVSLLPLLDKKNRTTGEIRKAIVTVLIILGVIIAVLLFQVNVVIALLFGFLAMILFDKKTYTKKRLIIYSSIILVVVGSGSFIFREDPDYVLNHLKENPQSSSLYVVENGEELISYQAEVVRPLASTVKMLIAVEYAMQIQDNKLNKEEPVSLDTLERFYIKNTDGNAHERWLEQVESEGKIKENSVTLHEVAKGMIAYSSNANTDYLIHLLGVEAINERAKLLGLTQHEEVYPIVSALLIPSYVSEDSMSERELIDKLKAMPLEEYRTLAKALSEQMKDGTINADTYNTDLSLNIQKVWSDRLIGASAKDYGKLLSIVSNDELPPVAAKTVRELLEWPMKNIQNKEQFVHKGAKGGSTAFILNNAVYIENHNGEKMEYVILLDGLNIMESIMLQHNFGLFESQLVGNEEYRKKVQEELTGSF